MPTTRPFAYNTGSTIANTTQVGNLAVVTGGTGDYSGNIGGVDWWMGPDEDLGYVIAHQSPNGQPTPVGKTAYLGFWRSIQKTDSSFVSLANYVSNNTQNFIDGNTALTWLNTNGYWTSFTGASTLAIDYLVVAGGGGSGADNRAMGGSGAGGFLSGATTFTLNLPLTITVGAGGAKLVTSSSTAGNRGNTSSITGSSVNISATGGGATSPASTVQNGGSGAGASVFSSGISNALGTGISGQGNNGGNGCTQFTCGARYAGGGGGAGAVGQDGNASNGGGDGGNGLTWHNGTTYAGGGGGSTYAASNAGSGGTGGGGNGAASVSGVPTDGGVNTGGGGGGGAAVSRTTGGGSGIVIIRYLGTTQKATGGTITTSGGYTYHTFTGTGTFTPTSA